MEKHVVKHSAGVSDGVHSVSTTVSRTDDSVGHAQRQLTSEPLRFTQCLLIAPSQ